MFEKLANLQHSHGRIVLAVAVVGAAVAGVFGSSVSKYMSPFGANDPATQSVQATNRFQGASGRQIEPGVVALVNSGAVSSAGARERVDAIAARLRAEPAVASVVSYYSAHNPAMVSSSGDSTYLLVYFKPLSDRRLQEVAKGMVAHFKGDPSVKLGGITVANAEINAQVSHDLEHAELLVFPLIFLLSLLFFRSLVAAILPPLLGGLAIVFTFFALRIVTNFVDLSVFALNLTTGLGLGLAIDYSLFMVSRYREESATLGFGLPALTRTLHSAGRTILFSALTVAGAVASLMIFPQSFLYSMGIAGALVVLLAGMLALVVLPALLAVLGPRVNALAPKRLARAVDREARPDESGFWYRLAQFIMHRPGRIAVSCAVVLIALGIPFMTGVKFISVDTNQLPPGATAKVVNASLEHNFSPNLTAPVNVVVGAPAGSASVRALAAQVAQLPDVAAVAPAQSANAGLSLLSVSPRQSTYSAPNQRLVRTIRALHEPFYVGVAGQTAADIDLEHSLGVHLPAVAAIVVGATVLVLFLMMGSIVLPIKAVLMNVLSLSAMFGILVLIFQDGHLQGLLDFRSLGALNSTQPVLLFVIAFGLATDYGVFLLSRIKEARDTGSSNNEAVAIGLERTGRIVTAAAVLFAVAMAAFASSQIVFIKELGLGTALAVLIDASVIRALLVPSLMALLGDLNWWAPAPLRRLHQRIGLSDSAPPPARPPRTSAAAAAPALAAAVGPAVDG
jgi:RND superfamily putative drug exporter